MLGKSQSNLENMIRAENVPDRSVQNHKLQIQNAALKKEHSNVQVEGEGSSLLCFKKKKKAGEGRSMYGRPQFIISGKGWRSNLNGFEIEIKI